MQPTKIDLKVINIGYHSEKFVFSIAFYGISLIFTEVRDDFKLY